MDSNVYDRLLLEMAKAVNALLPNDNEDLQKAIVDAEKDIEDGDAA